jgi:hypothetical protein
LLLFCYNEKVLTNGNKWNKKSAQQKKWFLNWRGSPQNGR